MYGGRRGIYGNLPVVLSQPYADRITAGSNLVGMGFTPEAIDEIPIMFDAAMEAFWRNDSADPAVWMQAYAVRRYGRVSPSLSAAMPVLLDAAYTRDIDTSSVEKVPELMEDGEPGYSRNTNATGILQALRLFVAAGQGGEVDITTGPWSYDLTDLTRQVLCNIFSDLHNLAGQRWTSAQAQGLNNTAEIAALRGAMLGLLADLDTVNAADPNFLLGTWLSDASQWAFNASQLSNLLFNAKNQITLWGWDVSVGATDAACVIVRPAS